ncbi:MAG: hypothetical protein WCI76_00225 [bacterium]
MKKLSKLSLLIFGKITVRVLTIRTRLLEKKLKNWKIVSNIFLIYTKVVFMTTLISLLRKILSVKRLLKKKV